MKLSEHFTLEEATVSETAARMGIDNSPDEAMLEELRKTAAFMEGVRAMLGKPILVTSWYRCPELERVVANIAPGRPLSGHHPRGGAVDFICPGFGSPYVVARQLASAVDRLGVGQLIYEFGRWVHISRLPVPNPINRVITIDTAGVRVGICQ
ncbi:MAG: peptidase M15A [Planctomycetes bacterium]|nr:peptidase M15A [Planctomycetota bacterium]